MEGRPTRSTRCLWLEPHAGNQGQWDRQVEPFVREVAGGRGWTLHTVVSGGHKSRVPVLLKVVLHCSKASKEARLLYFGGQQMDQGSKSGGWTHVQRLTPLTDNQWISAFIEGGRGLHAETAWSALKLVMCHLDGFKYS